MLKDKKKLHLKLLKIEFKPFYYLKKLKKF